MKFHETGIRKSINKAFLKIKPNRTEIEKFKKNLFNLLEEIDESESEEFHKNIISNFLKSTYYAPNFYINTKERTDLVIHNGHDASSSVGILIETKKPTNKTEMVDREYLNRKALHELLLYYLRERVAKNNIEIKHLIITNIYEWFIFDATDFDRIFAQNKKLIRNFTDFEEGRLGDTRTEFFYKQVAEPFIELEDSEMPFTCLDIRDYENDLSNNSIVSDKKLIAIFKLFSPENLLKLPFVNDSNTLDKKFYTELLHIIGLHESKKGGKKLIGRKPAKVRNEGCLIENTINILKTEDCLSQIKAHDYGKETEEQLFNVALELVITWINRILFLKLLEGQLVKYNAGDKSFRFLSYHKVSDFDTLNKLFFQVLAIKEEERNERARNQFPKIPYLNSSLFEPTELESKTIRISNLEDNYLLPVFKSTVLTDKKGKRKQGKLNTLEYLLYFLDAYDFSSEGSEEIQEENKTLINASVLGLIFEKINGYKEGSFFTPGFITMFMSRETVRKAVIQKFNDIKGWCCSSLEEIYNKIEDKKEANNIINSLRICDPAVGSGHFLVSVLNEIIAIKSYLKILLDKEGKILRDYHIEVINDELVITGEEGLLFEYKPKNMESQRVQETIFHEKQTIIENCLFGVDINPNSVKICRLRLWIELLKNAYYKPGTGELETLPNIDINIKCGNSLISRFPLDADISKALKNSKWNIESYRLFITTYRQSQNKDQKRSMEKLIEKIKNDFETEISRSDKRYLKLNRLKGELYTLTNQQQIFQQTQTERTAWNKKIKKYTAEIQKLENELEEIRTNKIYENAFEWRFEFPEVLNDEGDFIGFDVVIGNPPYMRVQEINATQPTQKLYYESHYLNAKASYDLANIFFELAVNISASDSNNAFIFPHKFFNASSSEVFRNYLKKGRYIDEIAHFGANMVFEDADTYTCIARFSKKPSNGFYFQRFPFKSDFMNLMLNKSLYTFITYEMLEKASELYGSNQWILFDSKVGFNVFQKIYSNSKLFSSTFKDIFVGLQTSLDKLYILEKNDSHIFKVPISGNIYELEPDLFKPFLMGKDVHRYSYLSTNHYVFFPYKIIKGKAEIVPVEEIKYKYPHTYQYIMDHENLFRQRENGKAGKMKHWHAYIYPKNLSKFEQPKLTSMEICAYHPNVTFDNNNLYHTTKAYSWIKNHKTKESYEYLLAIANSKLLWWFLKITGDTLQGDARTFKTNYLNPFPLPRNIDPEIEKAIVEKVKKVMARKKEDPDADTQIQESEIDQMIYRIYGLNEEEKEVVEEAG